MESPIYTEADFEVGHAYRVKTIDREYPDLRPGSEPNSFVDTGKVVRVPGRVIEFVVISHPVDCKGFIRVLNLKSRRQHMFSPEGAEKVQKIGAYGELCT